MAVLHAYLHHTLFFFLSISYIIEPCRTLVTPDGYSLAAEGVRVLACFAGGALVLIYPQLAAYSYMCGRGISIIISMYLFSIFFKFSIII
jgi:hypothetical protein